MLGRILDSCHWKRPRGPSKATLSCSSLLHVEHRRPGTASHRGDSISCWRILFWKGVCHWWQLHLRAPGTTWGTTDLSIFLPQLITKKKTKQFYWCEHGSWRGRKQKTKTREEHVRFRKWNIEKFYPWGHLLQNIAKVFLRRHTASFPFWKGKGFLLRRESWRHCDAKKLSYFSLLCLYDKSNQSNLKCHNFLSLFSKRYILIFQTKKGFSLQCFLQCLVF